MNPSQFIYEEKLKSLFYNTINENIDKFRKELFSLENFSLEEIYKKIDISQKTFINSLDISEFLSSYSITVKDFSLKRLIRTYDKRGNVILIYDEFLNLIHPRYQNEFIQEGNIRNEEEILIDIIMSECNLFEKINEQCIDIRNCKDFTTFEAFMLISKDQRYINIDDLKIFLNEYNIDDNKLEWIIYRLDLDNDKQISYEEFQDIFFPFQNHLKVEDLDENNIYRKEISNSIKDIEDPNNYVKTLPIDIDNIESDGKEFTNTENKKNELSDYTETYKITGSPLISLENKNIVNYENKVDSNFQVNKNEEDNRNFDNNINYFNNNFESNNIIQRNENYNNNQPEENQINYNHKLVSPENIVVQYDENLEDNEEEENNDKIEDNNENISNDIPQNYNENYKEIINENSEQYGKFNENLPYQYNDNYSNKIKGNLTPQENYRQLNNFDNSLDNSYSKKQKDLFNEQRYYSEQRHYDRKQLNDNGITQSELNYSNKYPNKDYINANIPQNENYETNNKNYYYNTIDYFKSNINKKTEDPNFSTQNFLPKNYITSMPSNTLNLNIEKRLENQLILQLTDFLSDIIEKKTIIETLKENICLKEDIILEDLFYDFDISRNHEIKIEDFLKVCRNFALFPTKDQLFLLYKKYDNDLDQALNYKEFCQMILPIKREYSMIISNREINPLKYNEISFESKQLIKELIKGLINIETYLYEARAKLRTKQTFSCVNAWNLIIKYSKNGKEIDKEKFKLFFDDNGCFYTRFEIEILFNDMDLDKKGKINYKDFARIILNM